VKRPVAVLDIDGTVADVTHRVHLLDTDSPSRWAEFFNAAAADPPLLPGAALARQLAAEHDIVWLTGRPERLREDTHRWLVSHGLPAGELLMRPSDDLRTARMFKLERLDELRRSRDIAIVVDDDPRVIDHLPSAGLPVRQATWSTWMPVLGQQ